MTQDTANMTWDPKSNDEILLLNTELTDTGWMFTGITDKKMKD